MPAGKDANWTATYSPLRKARLSEPQQGSDRNRSAEAPEETSRGFRAAGSASVQPARGRWQPKRRRKAKGVPRRAAKTTGTADHESGNAGVQQGSPEQPRQRCSTLRFARAGRFGVPTGKVRKDHAGWSKEADRTLAETGMAGEPPNQRRFAWKVSHEALRCGMRDQRVSKTVRQSRSRRMVTARFKRLQERGGGAGVRRSAGEGQVARKGHPDRS